MITVGHRLNGRWAIVAVAASRGDVHTGEGVELVILATAEDDGEWVTARMHPDRETSWFWGNYFPPGEAEDAWRSFIDRIGALDVPIGTA